MVPAVVAAVLLSVSAHAGNFGIGTHAGFGVFHYNEFTDVFGPDIESDTTLDAVILGGSAEYTFPKIDHVFTGITADLVFGLEDIETWEIDDTEVQTNDISIFGQFYDARLGYKNDFGNLSYRVYASGGWDGISFRRKNFFIMGSGQSTDAIREDFSLWRVGGGIGLGYSFGTWAIDGRAAYSYYFDGEVRNTGNSGLIFDTNGTCIDVGFGIMKEIVENLRFYIGATFTRIRLDESEVSRDVKTDGITIKTEDSVFPESIIHIAGGVINLTYSF